MEIKNCVELNNEMSKIWEKIPTRTVLQIFAFAFHIVSNNVKSKHKWSWKSPHNVENKSKWRRLLSMFNDFEILQRVSKGSFILIQLVPDTLYTNFLPPCNQKFAWIKKLRFFVLKIWVFQPAQIFGCREEESWSTKCLETFKTR